MDYNNPQDLSNYELQDWAKRPLRAFGPMMALAILFPIHFFFLRRITSGVIFWVLVLFSWTVIVLIVIVPWWFVNLFLAKGWVEKYNAVVKYARDNVT